MKRIQRAVHSSIAFLLLALLCHQTSLAQVDPWQRVKLIEPGKGVHVKLHSGKTVKGKMESWSADGLSVRQGKDKIVQLAKSDVAHVAMVTGMSRGRKAGYAGLIGGAVGGVLMGAVCASTSDCDVPPAGMAAGSAFWIGGIAAAIAALFPQHKEVIYTAESAPLRGGGSDSSVVGSSRDSDR